MMSTSTSPPTVTQGGMTVTAYRGDEAVLLAFDLDQTLTPHLAGFAIECTPPNGQAFYIPNRLSFSVPVTNTSTPQTRAVTPSNVAPIQKFRWLHIPTDFVPGTYTYNVTAMYFDGAGGLKPGPTAQIPLDLDPLAPLYPHFEVGFTRGDLSSQAYVDLFQNAPFEPSPKSLDFDTATYEKQYQWLGFHARKLIFDTLDECIADPSITVDVFAFDLDEPDFVRGLEKLGSRLRIVLDDATLHTNPGSLEIEARQRLEQSAGAGNVVSGHFQRFAHDKVIIEKRNGTPVKVLTGSANFSVRGVYVQANNVLIFDDPQAAGLYEQAFEEAFTDMSGFSHSPVAGAWFDLTGAGLPPCSVSFAPHAAATISLDRIAQAIEGAQSSVLYAVMELGGSGQVLADLQALGGRNTIFAYGVTQSNKGLNLYPPGSTNAIFTPFAFLQNQVPPPFKQEWGGGLGQVIHHKFVVVDFNGTNPVVFTGSSNLAAGGEEQNGDNLLAIADPLVAGIYAVEAVRLVDHYHFRALLQTATSVQPLVLQGDDKQWWAPYYDPTTFKYRDRLLFARN